MTEVTAVLSMLHEPSARAGARPADSASRLFRGQPVLAWTLSRLSRARNVAAAVVVCWDDQLFAVTPLATETGARVHSVGPRRALATMDAVSAALRWTDGWRGGLLGATHFDRGFHGTAALEAADDAHAVVLIDPSAGLVDPALVDALVAHADAHPEVEYVFSQSAPGIGGIVIRRPLLERLATAGTYPGRLFAYSPDAPSRDPITTDSCLAVPPQIARTLHRLTLDSDRQIRRLTAATEHLNGSLISTDARGLIAVLDAATAEHLMPRDVTLEVTTTRATRPIFAPGTHLRLGRGDLSIAHVRDLIEQFAAADDLRLILAGAGDPLLHPEFPAIADLLSISDISAIHVETDLVDVSDQAIYALARGRFDVVTVQLPAATAGTYERVMGVGQIEQAVRNLSRLLQLRTGPTPIVVPTFTKCRENLDEMEPWYDHFLRTVGAAAIVGPSDFAGQIPDHACADMSPPRRRPCQRIQTRMTIRSDGAVPPCEQDVLGAHAVATVNETVTETWKARLRPLREAHHAGDLSAHPLCVSCREWHRP
ncbi:MAG TPA: radical SAM/SPASM domain-containing protein [Tepidisphaeraceae bacterium]|nr:radical SAM/SPASM domain-containing protein [Tepidisphaeraceae bacterium]